MTVYLTEADGTRVDLPPCSDDWKPSVSWAFCCIHDVSGPVCQGHLQFFRERKENAK